MNDISNAYEIYILTMIVFIWALTGMRQVKKGWRNLDLPDKNIFVLKVITALALIFTSIAVFIRTHGR